MTNTGPSDRTQALARRVWEAELATLDAYVMYVGERLRLYEELASGGAATSEELARRAGIDERYAREWLEHQAVAEILDVEDGALPARERRYSLPPEHAAVLADRDSEWFSAHTAVDLVRAGRRLPHLVEAFRTGGGLPPIPWEPEGRADFNRPLFVNLLGKRWLPAIPDLDERLRAEPPARVADVACGTGWSSIAMAQAYPRITVDGFDLDPDAIRQAKANALAEGVQDRVGFRTADAADPGYSGRYDLATIIEALHDMAHPVAALRAARSLVEGRGWVLVVDEKVGDEFGVPADEREHATYGWSVVSCLPDAMGVPGTAATGAVMRAATLRRYAAEAGFAEVQGLPIDTEYWRFYRLVP